MQQGFSNIFMASPVFGDTLCLEVLCIILNFEVEISNLCPRRHLKGKKTALRHEHRRGNQIQGHRDRRRDLLFQCFRHGHPQSGGVQHPQDHTSRTTQHEPWQFRGGRQQVIMRPRLRRHLEESPDLRSHLGGDHRKVEKED